MLEAEEPSQPGDRKIAFQSWAISGEPHTGAVHPGRYKQHLSTPRSPHAIGNGVVILALVSLFDAVCDGRVHRPLQRHIGRNHPGDKRRCAKAAFGQFAHTQTHPLGLRLSQNKKWEEEVKKKH